MSLAWTPVARASHYRIEVAADAGFTTRVTTYLTTEPRFDLTNTDDYFPELRQKGRSYHWRVRGIDRGVTAASDDRPASPWSTTSTFVYDPPVTSLLEPADGATVTVPTLSWSTVDTRFHRITIKDSTGAVIDEAITYASSYTPGVLLDPADGPFTWYLERIAPNVSCCGGWVAWKTVERTFDVRPLVSSDTLSIIGPTDLHTVDNPRLRWTPLSGAAYYHVVLPPASPGTDEHQWTAEPVVYPDHTFEEPLKLGSADYQIWAYDDDGDVIAKSSTASWTIDPLPAPTSVSPDCGGSTCPVHAEPPRLSWSEVPGATLYAVEPVASLGRNATPRTTGLSVQPGQDTPTDSLSGPTGWTVTACIANRCGPTATGSFRKEGASPALTAPAADAALVGPQVTLDWDSLLASPVGAGVLGVSESEPASYRPILWPDDPDGGPYSGGSDRADGTQRTFLLMPGSYRWTVHGDVIGVYATPASERRFTVSWPGPTLSGPAPSASVPRTPVFSWSAATYVDSYAFELFAGASASGTPMISTSTTWPSFVPVDELGAGTFTWRVKVNPGSSWSTPRTFTIVPEGDAGDSSAPVGTLVVAGGAAYTTTTSVTLSTAATDLGSGLSQVALSNDGATWTTRPYAATQPWTLSTTNGSQTVHARWRDAAGNWSPVSTDSIVLDTMAPATTVPRRGFAAGSSVTNGSIALRVPWSGSDATSGIDRYELQRQVDGGAWTIVSTTLTAPQSTTTLATQHAYRFRVRAMDKAGNVGAWAYGDTFRVLRFSEGNSRIAYRGTWTTARSSVFWGGVAKASSRAGASASITFTGRSIAWVASMGPTRGKGVVFVNGVKVATIDLYSATSRHQRVVWTGSWTSATSRTISIRVQGTTGRPRVDLDAFVTAD